ncbi:MAG: hypothetical protein J7K21_02375 [Desulfurococcales archaeon]|nr:hypothetical protein [Desulfurococcales archaeon]
MVSCPEILEQLAKWLKEGRPDANNLVDFPWEIERSSNDTIRAIHPRFPVEINILCSDEAESIRAVIATNIITINMDNPTRVKLYRRLLRLNNMPFAKYILFGEEDSVAVAVDLSIYSLGKREFNDALAFLISGLVSVAKEFGIEEELYQSMINELASLVAKHFEEGWSREKLLDYLVNIVGMNPKDAEEFLRNLGIKAPEDLISRARDTISM